MLGASVATARCAGLPSARVFRDAHGPLLDCRKHKPCLMRQTITTHLLVIANRSVSRSLLAWVCWCIEGEEVGGGNMFHPVFPDCRSGGCESNAAAGRSSAAITLAAGSPSCGECARRRCPDVSWRVVRAKNITSAGEGVDARARPRCGVASDNGTGGSGAREPLQVAPGDPRQFHRRPGAGRCRLRCDSRGARARGVVRQARHRPQSVSPGISGSPHRSQ